MKNYKKQTILYIENTGLFIIGLTLLLLPLLFFSINTDAFILPKQILLSASVSILAILFGVRTIIEGKIKFRTTPFDIPVLLLAIFALISSLLSLNRLDALTAYMPFLFTTLLFFLITNTVKRENSLLIIISSLVLGACLSALLSVLSYFKIYILPFQYTQATYFNTFGSLLDQAIYYALIIPITVYFIISLVKKLKSGKKIVMNTGDTPISIGFSVSFVILLAGLAITGYQLLTSQKPLILPLETGFQTAFAAISQENGRIMWGFLFGSGFGTYLADFTRFKSPAYNLNPELWSFTFFRSSTFILELLATTGITGLFAFIFLIFRILKERNFFYPLIIAVILAFLLPFSFTILCLFYALLGIFAVTRAHNNPEKFAEIEFFFVALRRGLLAAKPEGESISLNTNEKKYSKLLPILFFLMITSLVIIPLYFMIRLFLSDLYYKKSLEAYAQNNGLATYNLQLNAVNIYPFRDLYYRGLSQTNIALANALALQEKDGEGNTKNQQNIIQLIQQSINSGRNATMISPITSFNWSNLSSIYRSLIGFGENADKFAILTNQQAIALDPNNPQQYIDLGGIYYQLKMYDDAIRQFQIAINLKNDYANAYYNLGHALEAKGGNDNEALSMYQVTRSLVADNKDSTKKIDDEILALTKKINQETTGQNPANNTQTNTVNEPLQINKPETQLPEREPQISIPGPTISPLPSPAQEQDSTTPTPTQVTTPAP